MNTVRKYRSAILALLLLLTLAVPCACAADMDMDTVVLFTVDCCIPGNDYVLIVLRPGASAAFFDTGDILDIQQAPAVSGTVTVAWFIPGFQGGQIVAGGIFSDGGASPRAAGSCRTARLPSGTTTLDEGAFQGTPFTHIYLPDGLTRIGPYAFADCTSLQYVAIPPSVKTIASTAFSGSDRVWFGCVKGSAAWDFGRTHGIFCLETTY